MHFRVAAFDPNSVGCNSLVAINTVLSNCIWFLGENRQNYQQRVLNGITTYSIYNIHI